jgi:two-component system LytT family sensor kinase
MSAVADAPVTPPVDAAPAPPPPASPSRLARFRELVRPGGLHLGWVALIWLGIGAVDEARQFLRFQLVRPDRDWDWEISIVSRLFDIAHWTVFTAVIYLICRRWTLGRGRGAGPVLVHVAAACAFGMASTLLNWGLAEALWKEYPLARFIGRVFHANVLSYVAAAAVCHLVIHARAARERALRESELQERLSVAQLQALKTQIEPHFLFNTLNSVAQLIHENPAAAERMLDSLADLLRLTIDLGQASEVTLEQEVRILTAYLEIQRMRFEDRLRFSLHVPPELRDALVPSLVLQPLVENSIRHGLTPRAAPGNVRVDASADEDGRLRLVVTDDGVGLPGGGPPREGVGLKNTRARLQRLYGAAHRFEVRPGAEGGAVATVLLPFRRAADNHGRQGRTA